MKPKNITEMVPSVGWLGRPQKVNVGCSDMMIADDTLKRLLRINDGLFQLCKQLTDKGDIETSSRLIPLVDSLSHILIEAGKNKLQ